MEDIPIRVIWWRNMSGQRLWFSLRFPLACRDNVYARGQDSIHFSSWSLRWNFQEKKLGRKSPPICWLLKKGAEAGSSRHHSPLRQDVSWGNDVSLKGNDCSCGYKKIHELPYHRIFQWLVTKITSKSIHPEQISNWCTDIPCTSLAMLFPPHHGPTG